MHNLIAHWELQPVSKVIPEESVKTPTKVVFLIVLVIVNITKSIKDVDIVILILRNYSVFI